MRYMLSRFDPSAAGLVCCREAAADARPPRRSAARQSTGKVQNLSDAVTEVANGDFVSANACGIAHTRWATHGCDRLCPPAAAVFGLTRNRRPPNAQNCHPHVSPSAGPPQFSVVHNGIITNHAELRSLLVKHGFQYASETDTESIVMLLQYIYEQRKATGAVFGFADVVEDTLSQLDGAFALVVQSAHYPGQLVAARRGSPLLIGIKHAAAEGVTPGTPSHVPTTPSRRRPRARSADSTTQLPILPLDPTPVSVSRELSGAQGQPVEYVIASDASAIIEHTQSICFLEDGDVAEMSDGRLAVRHLGRAASTREVQTIELELDELAKGEYEHFMLKEIHEQPESLLQTMRGRLRAPDAPVEVVLGGITKHLAAMGKCRRLLFLACGTSYNSALACRQWLEETTEMPVVVDIASDFLDRNCPIFRDDVCFFISQSGETADTLSALRYCKRAGALLIGVTNTVGSSLSRETDCGVHVNAGPEIGVASTKAYTCQVLVLIMLGLLFTRDRISMQDRQNEVIADLRRLPDLVRGVLAQAPVFEALAAQLADKTDLLIMGRGYSFANCLEGALKIKELAYIHAEAILAGELKHGPLALIEPAMPIVMFVMPDSTHTKSLNALAQICARGGKPIIVCIEGHAPKAADPSHVFTTIEVPAVADCLQSIVSIIPLQLLSYYIARAKGYNVDQPRNLAKSVTVE